MQWAVASSGVLKIDRVGVGVGVILYSPAKKTAAGIHVLAPNSVSATPENPAKYANTAIPYAIEQLEKQGAKPPLSVAIVGGASMLQGAASMGEKVVAAVKDALKKAGLIIKLDKSGGSKIRSMTVDIETGKIEVNISPEQ
jgi:chemotaxis protein CheD